MDNVSVARWKQDGDQVPLSGIGHSFKADDTSKELCAPKTSSRVKQLQWLVVAVYRSPCVACTCRERAGAFGAHGTKRKKKHGKPI